MDRKPNMRTALENKIITLLESEKINPDKLADSMIVLDPLLNKKIKKLFTLIKKNKRTKKSDKIIEKIENHEVIDSSGPGNNIDRIDVGGVYFESEPTCVVQKDIWDSIRIMFGHRDNKK